MGAPPAAYTEIAPDRPGKRPKHKFRAGGFGELAQGVGACSINPKP